MNDIDIPPQFFLQQLAQPVFIQQMIHQLAIAGHRAVDEHAVDQIGHIVLGNIPVIGDPLNDLLKLAGGMCWSSAGASILRNN